MFKDSWVIYAILSAFFAALTSILAKIGISDINSNLATAIRTIVVLIMAWGIVFMTGAQSGIQDITAKSWIFLVLSGIATGLSWLFYYKALQLGDASKVVPIDKFSVVISMILDIQDGYGRYSYNSRYFCNDSLIKKHLPYI